MRTPLMNWLNTSSTAYVTHALMHFKKQQLLYLMGGLMGISGISLNFISTAHAQYVDKIDEITQVEPITATALPPYVFRGKTPNILLPLSVEWPITSAAWRLPEKIIASQVNNKGKTIENIYTNIGFNPNNAYIGYFNPVLCYAYHNGNTDYFYPTGRIDAKTGCASDQFSGSLMNWLTLSSLDLVRYALTGGDRLVDDPKQTIVSRSRIFSFAKDVMIDFKQDDPNSTLWTISEHTKRFPIKDLQGFGLNGAGGAGSLYARSCGYKVYVANNTKQLIDHPDCESLTQSNLQVYTVNVKVCDALDASYRPNYCMQYPNDAYKPVGVLQTKSTGARIGMMSYLNFGRPVIKELETLGKLPRRTLHQPNMDMTTKTAAEREQYWLGERIRHLWGGVLRAPNKFLGAQYYNTKLNFGNNPMAEINPETGVILKSTSTQNLIFATGTEPVKDGGPSVIGYINHFGKKDYVETDDLTEMMAESLRYLSNQSGAKPGVSDPVSGLPRNPLYFFNKWVQGPSQSNTSKDPSITDGKLTPADQQKLLNLHFDGFPVLRSWAWKNEGTSTADSTKNLADEPVRSTCEANNIPRLIMLSDSNNWHAGMSTGNSDKGFKTSTGLDNEDNGGKDFFVGRSIKSGLNDYVNHNQIIVDGALSDALPQQELVQDKYSPKYTHPNQNRYLASALAALANLNGIHYQNLASNRTTEKIRVKTTMIDVGEPLIENLMNHAINNIKNPSATTTAEDCHLFYAGALGSANSLNSFIQSFTKDACTKFLAARYQQVDTGNGIVQGNSADMERTMPPGYFYPSNPQRLVSNIQQAFEVPFEISGNFSAGTFGDYQIIKQQDGRYVPQVSLFQFDLDVFKNEREQTNNLRSVPKKYIVTRQGGGTLNFAEVEKWSENLNKSMRNAANRTVYWGALPFDDKLMNEANQNTQAQRSILLNNVTGFITQATQTTEAVASNLINYIRGDASQEGTVFRKRDVLGKSIIGSTQNSSPLFVGKAKAKAEAKDEGRDLIYVAANDGMLHAFNAQSGEIDFSYIPNTIGNKIGMTAQEGYQNMPLVETHPVVKNIFEAPATGSNGSNGSSTQSMLLAGGFGAGANGVYGLDITSLHHSNQAFNASNPWFEFTDKDDVDVGQVIGQPEIIELTAKNAAGKSYRQSYLMFTSGYNYKGVSSTDPEKITNPYLFLLKITQGNKGKGIVSGKNWTLNTDYFKLELKTGDFTKKINNGLTTTTTISSNGVADKTYFGDLYGNLWRVSNLQAIVDAASSTNATIVRLFKGYSGETQSSALSNLRPITAKPNYAFSAKNGLMLTFGTGRFLGINDLGSKYLIDQSIISVIDAGANSQNIALSDLSHNSINDAGEVNANSSGTKGWYTDIPDGESGMRATTTPQIVNGNVVFTAQTTGTFATNLCGQNKGGIGVLDLDTGKKTGNTAFTAKNYFVGQILLLPPLNFSSLGSGNKGASRTSVNKNEVPVENQFSIGATNDTANTTAAGTINNSSIQTGTLSWREIIQR